jgi:crotonobetainyl-CoA:carnitine CoA-transferase CaiB-like acyl-CoA transferase
MLSVVGCLAALYHQRVTGEGQELWTSLLDGGAVFASDALLVDGEPVERPRHDQRQHGVDACYRLYETQDGWIQIAAVKESEWVALCGALGAPELADDERFAVADLRREHRAQLETLLGPRFLGRTSVSWSHALDDAGVPNEIPLDTLGGEVVLHDADNVALGLVAEYEHPMMGVVRQFGSLVQFSDAPYTAERPPPLVGQHTREILEWLGHDSAEIDALHADNVVGWPGDEYPWAV